jgi:hypothetical protein
MTRRRTLIILTVFISAAVGCKRPADPPTPQPTTRVAVAATEPATQPVAEAPANFIINNQAFLFPAPKLVAVVKDNALRVTLFSNDPPEALREGYTGNSLYFRFNLDGDSADDLAGQHYVFRNSYTEQDDSTNGLFIAGGRQTLRPADVTVGFEKVGQQLIVHVNGTFKLIDENMAGNDTAIIRVRAMLELPPSEAIK